MFSANTLLAALYVRAWAKRIDNADLLKVTGFLRARNPNLAKPTIPPRMAKIIGFRGFP